MVAMSLTVKVLSWVGVQRRVWERRQWAVQEASNQMERLTCRPFDEVTPASVKEAKLSTQAQATLPEAELKIELKDNDSVGGPGSKRIIVQVRWKNRGGEWDAPVRLTSWVFRGRRTR
jgi:hypothetical protein